MSIYKRPESSRYVVEVRWRGVPRMKLSTGTSSKTRAGAMERTLQALRDVGRFDVLRLLADGKLRLADVHEDYLRDPVALKQRIAKVASPVLGSLVDQWLKWLESPAVLSSRTRRPFIPGRRIGTVSRGSGCFAYCRGVATRLWPTSPRDSSRSFARRVGGKGRQGPPSIETCVRSRHSGAGAPKSVTLLSLL